MGCGSNKMNKLQELKYWKLNKYNQVDYIKRFVNGVSKKELIEMFRKHLLEGFVTLLIANKLLKNQNEQTRTT